MHVFVSTFYLMTFYLPYNLLSDLVIGSYINLVSKLLKFYNLLFFSKVNVSYDVNI